MNKDKQRSQEDEAFLQALNPVVNELIDKNYQNSQKKIASQIAPLLGNAIREQVRSQKDDIIDALYPVLGTMISRYVTKTLENTLDAINQQIHNGLSLQNIKRKIRAKLQGVSESELLLKENSFANLRALLLIHKETGVILAEAQNPDKPLQEPEMIASMMSAISSFVNDWIEKNESNTELGEIEYGGGKIIIENGGYCYLAVVVEGVIAHQTYEDIRNTLEFIVLKHGEEIRSFSGDLRKFANIEIYQYISMLVDSSFQKKVQTKKTARLFWLFWLMILGGVLFFVYPSFVQNTPQEPQQENTKDLMQLSSKVHYLLLGLNSDKGIQLHYNLEYPLLEVLGEVWDLQRKERVIQAFESFNREFETIKFTIDLHNFALQKTLFFDQGSHQIHQDDEQKLFDLHKKLLERGSEFFLEISGYTDTTGTPQAKQEVVHKRVDNVVELLQKRYFVAHTIQTKYIYEAPQDVDAIADPQAARCVRIELKSRDL